MTESPERSLRPGVLRESRLEAMDIFRGLSIVEVVCRHLLLIVLNRTLHFAVPIFPCMTADDFTQAAVMQPFNARRFHRGGFKKSLMPHVIWTLLYGEKIHAVGGDLLDWERWLFWLQ